MANQYKLTTIQVEEIKAHLTDNKLTQRKIADLYGVSDALISLINHSRVYYIGGNDMEEEQVTVETIHLVGTPDRSVGEVSVVSLPVKEPQQHVGGRNYFQSLVEDDVIEIKKQLRRGVSQRLLAKHYRVGASTISDINTGNTWRKTP
jgi:Trp operon repressor